MLLSFIARCQASPPQTPIFNKDNFSLLHFSTPPNRYTQWRRRRIRLLSISPLRGPIQTLRLRCRRFLSMRNTLTTRLLANKRFDGTQRHTYQHHDFTLCALDNRNQRWSSRPSPRWTARPWPPTQSLHHKPRGRTSRSHFPPGRPRTSIDAACANAATATSTRTERPWQRMRRRRRWWCFVAFAPDNTDINDRIPCQFSVVA